MRCSHMSSCSAISKLNPDRRTLSFNMVTARQKQGVFPVGTKLAIKFTPQPPHISTRMPLPPRMFEILSDMHAHHISGMAGQWQFTWHFQSYCWHKTMAEAQNSTPMPHKITRTQPQTNSLAIKSACVPLR